ncbi:MAG: sigma-54 dependent transcriptional regulator, partial [Gammaproteobacteria bacterium]
MTTKTSQPHVLLIEDETVFANAVCKHFQNNGYQCSKAGTLAEAQKLLLQSLPDLILLDMRLPDGSGLDFLKKLRNGDTNKIPVIVMTAYGELEDAVAAMKLNALDYLKKPVDLEELLLCVKKVLKTADVKRGLDYSRLREDHAAGQAELIGNSEVIQNVRQQIEHIGSIISRTEAAAPTVLILGETGSGKDIVAHLLHQQSARHDRPFVHIDCASLPKELIEAELFGHVKGAFTGAGDERTGLIEAAENGTVFLDEVAELTPDLQAKLLAVLERRVFRRLGSSHERPVHAWIIAATNRPLTELVDQGRFRADLLYRLQVLSLQLPPLRQRREDILILATYFADRTARKFGLPQPNFLDEAVIGLKAYHWPGNVRELYNEIERAVLLSHGNPLDSGSFRMENKVELQNIAPRDKQEVEPSLETTEQEMIRQALGQTSGNVSQAARKLGITRMTLRYRMQKYG